MRLSNSRFREHIAAPAERAWSDSESDDRRRNSVWPIDSFAAVPGRMRLQIVRSFDDSRADGKQHRAAMPLHNDRRFVQDGHNRRKR